MKKTNSRKQMDVLYYIYRSMEDNGYPPTVREICDAVNLSSPSTVHGHLKRLEDKGYLVKNASKPRALSVTPEGLSVLGINGNEIPMMGKVSAGQPIYASQEISDYFPLPPNFTDQDDLFMLTIEGDSMVNIGILDGDEVIVRRQHSARNGEVVIALTDENEATCKRFFKEDGYYRLQPENDFMEPIILKSVFILGKVVSLYRNFVD